MCQLPTIEEIEADDYSTAQVAAMHDEIIAIKGKSIVINMSRDSLRAKVECLHAKNAQLRELLCRWQNWNYGADGDLAIGADTAALLSPEEAA